MEGNFRIFVLLLVISVKSQAAEGRHVVKRADDSDPVRVMVEQLAQQVAQLQAQVQANKNNIAAVEPVVGFTVHPSQVDVSGLGLHQIVKFDNVFFNAGHGYNPTTETFTTPLPGTYVFFLQMLNHNLDIHRVFLDIMKNGVSIARAHASNSAYENGSTMVVSHLNAGDTIHVEVAEGTMFWGGEYATFAGFRISPN